MLIYILSRGSTLYSTNRIYRSALRRRHNVRIIDHMECDLLVEDGEAKVIYNNEVLIKPDVLIPRIGSSSTAYGTAVVRHFEDMGSFVLNNAQSILSSRDKFSCLQLLAKNGIRVPKTYFSNDLHYAEQFVKKKLGYPFILKEIEGTQGAGVYLIKNEQEATEYFTIFSKKKRKVILQEFIAEFQGKDIRAFVVGGNIVAAMMRVAEEGEFRSNIHRGGIGKRILLSEEEKEMAIRAVKVLNLNIAGVDILRSKRGSLIIEVNSSPGLEGIEGATNAEIAEQIVFFVEEKFAHENK